jgi:hypothetical protein
MPRPIPPFNQPVFSLQRGKRIKLLCCLNSTIKILWLAKVKTLSPSATTSLKDSLKSVFRQALTVLVSFLGRFSINFQSLFGVPGDFNLGESRLVAYCQDC